MFNMKNLLSTIIVMIFTIQFTSQLTAQNLTLKSPITTNDIGKMYFEKILELEGDQEEIYQKAREWYHNTYKMTKAYGYNYDRAGGKISGRGKFDFDFGLLGVKWDYELSYVMRLDTKDGKIRIRFTDFIITEKANKTNSWKKREWAAEKSFSDDVCFKKNGKVKSSCEKFKRPTLDFITEIMTHFESSMTVSDDF